MTGTGAGARVEVPDTLIASLRRARRVAVLTGAGISAESGVPTFREAATGLWAQFDPADLATPEAFAATPQRVWDWYAWRRQLVSRAEPNPGHAAIVRLAGLSSKLTLITQNVDGLHQRAGSPAAIELHGNILRTRCSSENRIVDVWSDEAPRCPTCDAWLRPDVVWFGEMLPEAELTAAFHAAGDCDVFLAVGTSGIVHPAASLPIRAHTSGALVAVVNPERTPLADLPGVLHLAGSASLVLPAIVDGLRLSA